MKGDTDLILQRSQELQDSHFSWFEVQYSVQISLLQLGWNDSF